MALVAAFGLTACPVSEPSVAYDDDPIAGRVAANGANIQLAGSGTGNTAGVGGTESVAGVSGSSSAAGSDSAAGVSGGGVVEDGTGAGSEPSSVSFTVTTAAPGGRYQPKNIGAIWIQTPAGDFVKTLELWAKTRRRYLTKYNTTVGTSGAVDVTASATLPSHIAHRVSWDHRDRSGALLEAGAFRACVEVTDADATGPYYCLDFDTRAGMQSLTPADQPCFKSLTLTVD